MNLQGMDFQHFPKKRLDGQIESQISPSQIVANECGVVSSLADVCSQEFQARFYTM